MLYCIVLYCIVLYCICKAQGRGGGGVPCYMGYIGMCGPKGYGFSAIFVRNRVWFLHFTLELGFFKKKLLFHHYR